MKKYRKCPALLKTIASPAPRQNCLRSMRLPEAPGIWPAQESIATLWSLSRSFRYKKMIISPLSARKKMWK